MKIERGRKMFPDRPRRPMGPMQRTHKERPHNPFLFGSPRQGPSEEQPSNIQAFMNMFRDEEGKFDIGKMMHTMDQLNDVYKQVSPMINRFRSK